MISARADVADGHGDVRRELPLHRKIPLHVVSPGRILLHERFALRTDCDQVDGASGERGWWWRTDGALQENRKTVSPVFHQISERQQVVDAEAGTDGRLAAASRI